MKPDICRELIDHPSAWTAEGLGGVEGLRYPLSENVLSAIDDVLKKTSHLKPQAVSRFEFSHPQLDPTLRDLFEVIQNGRGAALISGLSPERYSEEDLERIYWGFGTHWGIAGVQSAMGDRLGHVRAEPGNPNGRGYRSDKELRPHTDPYEIVGLMCLQCSETGGETRLVSGLALHNEISKLHPELLEPLYEGHFYAMDEAKDTATPLTQDKIPVYCFVDGKVSMHYGAGAIDNAVRIHGKALSPAFDSARKMLCDLAESDRLRLRFTLRPGEALVVNNFTTMHSRTNFTNSAQRQRHLLRMWLEVPNGRAVIPQFHRRTEAYYARQQKSANHGNATPISG